MTWEERAEHAIARYRGGETRDADQRQLTQLANSAWAAGLSFLMAGRAEESADWLRRAASAYRESWDAGAPPDSWGRPIAAMKALLLAGDDAADAVVTIAAVDRAGYLLAIEDVLESFERRADFLEDVPVADTVLVLQALAAARGAEVELRGSSVLP